MAGSRLALVELRSVTAAISSEFPVQERVDSGQGTVVIQVDLGVGEMRVLGLGAWRVGEGVTRKKVGSRNQFDIPELVIGFTLARRPRSRSWLAMLHAAWEYVSGTRRVKSSLLCLQYVLNGTQTKRRRRHSVKIELGPRMK